MNIEEIRDYCLSKDQVTEGFPFDNTTLVFKVCGKMFALLSLETDHSINLKCEPEKAIELRAKYDFVIPGYHMNKTHWNTVAFVDQVNSELVKQWIDDSYRLIVESLPAKQREKISTF